MKKITVTLLLFFSVTLCKAQWVALSDPSFISWLNSNGYSSCMNGNQMDTTCSLIVNALWVNCQNDGINSLNGIQYFDNLQSLNCPQNNLTYLPPLPASLLTLQCSNNQIVTILSFPPALTDINCAANQLSSLPALPNTLTDFSCAFNQLTSLPTLPNSITNLYCRDNLLTVMPQLPSALIDFECSNNQLTVLPALPPLLKLLACAGNQLTTLPSLPDSLEHLQCNANQLTSLPPLPNSLALIYCLYNSITTFPPFPDSLRVLSCAYNPLTSLPDFPPTFRELYAGESLLQSLPELPDSMDAFNMYGASGLMCMPALHKLGGTNFNITGTGISCLPNVIQHTGSIPAIDNMPVCDLINQNGCQTYWNVSGKIYFDTNTDCDYQAGETLIPDVKLKLFQNGNLIEQGYFQGSYSFDTDLGDYKIEIDTANFPLYALCPPSGDTTVNLIPVDSQLYDIDFALRCKPGFDAGVLNIYSYGNFFPGDTAWVNVIIKDFTSIYSNGFCGSGVAGQVKVVIGGNAHYNLPASGALIPVVNGDTLIYNVSDFSLLNPYSAFAFSVLINTNAIAGNQICFAAYVLPDSVDNNPFNNNISHCFEVVNSYDPNEKEVSPIGSLGYPFNDWLTYTVHFQNTGTASAHNIQILDTLDAELDAATFELLSYSYAPMVQLFGNNVHFNFLNIYLPDSASDEGGSKGYVSYRVKPFANLPLGTTFENTASIYFDFNPPVFTNIVSSIICDPILPTSFSATTCYSDPYDFYGNLLNTSGNYSIIINAVNGCDSTINLNLTILNPPTFLNESICDGSNYNFNGVALNATGIYSDTFAVSNGCDSIIILHLFVDQINTNVQQSSDTLTVQTNSATIQWYDCESNQIISGATSTIFVPTVTGTYAAIISQGNCTDTSDCFLVVINSIYEISNSNWVSLYPNPVNDLLNVNCSLPVSDNKFPVRITITNFLGEKVHSQILNHQREIIDLKFIPVGFYFVNIFNDKFNTTFKMVKE